MNKLPNDPALPADVGLMRKRLTDLFRWAALTVNELVDSSDTPISAAAAQTLSGSPYVFTDPVNDGLLVVRGGTVSLIEYGRQGAFTTLGITAGLIPVKAGDSVRITYTVTPTVTLIPQ